MRLKNVSWCSEPVNIPGVAFNSYDSETAFQIYCADWLRKRFELTGNAMYARWHHSANERDGARAGFTAKMMGQSKGFPDLVHCGLRVAIELKVQGRQPSREQCEWLDYFREIGWSVWLIYSFEEFLGIMKKLEESC